MFDVGLPEMIVIMVIALVVFGPQKLPEIAKSLGKAIKEIKKASEEVKESLREESADSRELRNFPPQNYQPADTPEKDTDLTEPAGETSPTPIEAVPAEAAARASEPVEPPRPLHTPILVELSAPLEEDKAKGENKDKPPT